MFCSVTKDSKIFWACGMILVSFQCIWLGESTNLQRVASMSNAIPNVPIPARGDGNGDRGNNQFICAACYQQLPRKLKTIRKLQIRQTTRIKTARMHDLQQRIVRHSVRCHRLNDSELLERRKGGGEVCGLRDGHPPYPPHIHSSPCSAQRPPPHQSTLLAVQAATCCSRPHSPLAHLEQPHARVNGNHDGRDLQ
jgi:hypothetical protein